MARDRASRRTASLSRSRSPLERRAAAAGRRGVGAGVFGLVDYSPSRERVFRSPSVRPSPGRRTSERSSRTPRTSRTPRLSPGLSPPRRRSWTDTRRGRLSPRREYRRRSETPRRSLSGGGVASRRRSSGELLPPRLSPRRRSAESFVLPRLSPRGSRSRRPSVARSTSGRRLRGRLVRRRGWSSSSSSSSDSSSSPSPPRGAGVFKMQEMKEVVDRLEEIERVNTKLKKKDEDKFVWTKKGCETQFKFNNKVKDIAVDKMRVELRKHFKTLPPKIEELIKEGEKEIDDGNHKLKIANEFGFKAVEEFVKDDLARNDGEEKKLKRFRKEKKEREERLRGYHGGRGGRAGFRGQYSGYARGNQSSFVKDKKFVGGGSLGTSASSANGPTVKDLKCFQCQGYGHMARECTKAYVPRGRK